MGVEQGYSKIATSGLVFAYDTGDTVNSYKGKPTTNLLLGIEYTYGTQNQTYFKSSYGTETSYIPGLGGDFVNHYCNFFNDYNGGSGNCCPNPFSFGNFTVAPNTVYTYQIIYRTPDGYANTNYMYHYEYGPGGYVTEYGLWSAGRLEDLGNGWVHAWGTFTSNANTNYFQCYFFHYQYTQTKIQLAGAMLTQGSNIIPPRQFLTPQSSRSNTQGLLDISGTGTSINLANVSFNTNAMITFDGTDDTVGITTNRTLGSTFSLEAVININSRTNGDIIGSWNNPFRFLWRVNTSGYQLLAWNGGGAAQEAAGTTIVSTGAFNHITMTYDGTNVRFYNNGVFTNAVAKGFSLSNLTAMQVGSNTYDSVYFNGQIPVTKVYNRTLSTDEILNNFNHYKTRFNIA